MRDTVELLWSDIFGENPCNRAFGGLTSAGGVVAEASGAAIWERSVQMLFFPDGNRSGVMRLPDGDRPPWEYHNAEPYNSGTCVPFGSCQALWALRSSGDRRGGVCHGP